MARFMIACVCAALLAGCGTQAPEQTKPTPEKLRQITQLRQQLTEANDTLHSLNRRKANAQRELDKIRENLKKWQLAQNNPAESSAETPVLENPDPTEITPPDKDRDVDYSGLIAAAQIEIDGYLKKLSGLAEEIETAQNKVNALETQLAELEK